MLNRIIIATRFGVVAACIIASCATADTTIPAGGSYQLVTTADKTWVWVINTQTGAVRACTIPMPVQPVAVSDTVPGCTAWSNQ